MNHLVHFHTSLTELPKGSEGEDEGKALIDRLRE